MNKKGMTLIELLAVVGILATLAILVLPAAVNSYKNSKKSTFLTDVQTVMKTAVAQYQVDHPTSRSAVVYTRYNNEAASGTEALDLTGSTKMNYAIVLEKDLKGDVVVKKYWASDREFQYVFDVDGGELTEITDISADDIKIIVELPEEEKLDIDNVFERTLWNPEL